MKVTRAVAPFYPLLPLCQRLLPSGLAGLSLTLLKATALEVAILAGHLILYPTGITQERRPGTPSPAPALNPPAAARPRPRRAPADLSAHRPTEIAAEADMGAMVRNK